MYQHAIARFERDWVEAIVVVDPSCQLDRLCQLDQRGRFLRGHRQWLFAHHMFASQQGGFGGVEVPAIGRGEVDSVYFLVGDHFVEVAIGFGDAHLFGKGSRLLWRRTQYANYIDPQAAQCLGVGGSHKASAGERGVDVVHGGCSRLKVAEWQS